MDVPILNDTEPETSMEQDGEDQILSKVTNSSGNATRTLFNISFENLGEQTHKRVELEDYELRLHQEMKDWKSVLFDAYNDLKQSKQKHPVVDKTILPLEKRKYLEAADCLQNFIRGSVEFRQEAILFLEYDYAKFVEMLANLEGLCEHKLNLIKANKIAENLANFK